MITYNNASNNAPTSRPTTGPLNIFIIRHGEKNPTGSVDYRLNNNGISRAYKLISFFPFLSCNSILASIDFLNR